MNILLDGHNLNQKKKGLERYWKLLIASLLKIDQKNSYLIYTNKYLNSKFQFEKNSVRSKFNKGIFRIFFDIPFRIYTKKVDLVHLDYFTPFFTFCPVVITVHDLAYITNPELFSFFPWYTRSMWLKWSLKKSNAIICPSKFTKSEITRIYGSQIDKNKIFVIYEAADPIFKNLSTNTKGNTRYLHKKFHISGSYFLVPEDLEERGKPNLLLNAFQMFQKKHEEIQLIFTGSNKLKASKYKNLLKTQNLRFLNYVSDSDLNILYNCSKAVIYLSCCEGFGLPIIEAMACKIPVICNNLPVFKEIASSSALYINSYSDLYKTMELILEKEIFKKYSESGYQRSKKFSWLKNAKQTISVYKELIK